MAYTARRFFRDRIENLQPFRGSSTKAVMEGNVYVIYSFAEKIMAIGPNHELVFFDNTSWSSTTSCTQNICGGMFSYGEKRLNVNRGEGIPDYYRRINAIYYQHPNDYDLCVIDVAHDAGRRLKDDLIQEWNNSQSSDTSKSDDPLTDSLQKLKSNLLKLAEQ